MNEGEPVPILSFPYNRNRWTDIVMRVKASRSIQRGWIEFYLNQGASTTVKPVAYINGLTRIPRVTLAPIRKSSAPTCRSIASPTASTA